MDREIKFKIWDTVKKEIELIDSFYELQKMNRTKEELELLKIMQFTGLIDKNGKEIYEGDRIKTRVCKENPNGTLCLNESEERIFIVEWQNGITVGWNLMNLKNNPYETIGNIYEGGN